MAHLGNWLFLGGLFNNHVSELFGLVPGAAALLADVVLVAPIARDGRDKGDVVISRGEAFQMTFRAPFRSASRPYGRLFRENILVLEHVDPRLALDLNVERPIVVLLDRDRVRTPEDCDQRPQGILQGSVVPVVLDFLDEVIHVVKNARAYLVSQLGEVTVAIASTQAGIDLSFQVVG